MYNNCVILNLTNQEINLLGINIPANSTFLLPDNLRITWTTSDSVISAITNNIIQIGDGGKYFTTFHDQISWLNDSLSSNTSSSGGFPIGVIDNNNRIRMAVSPDPHSHAVGDIVNLDDYTKVIIGSALDNSSTINFNYDTITEKISASVNTSNIDHNSLQNLDQDSHPQYMNQIRSDLRYYSKTQLDNGLLDSRYYIKSYIDSILNQKLNSSMLGVPNGAASLDLNGQIYASQLPSYIDDVLEYENKSDFPLTGEKGKLYLDLSDNQMYRWGTTVYVAMVSSPGSTDSVPEGITNMYFTIERAAAAAPIQKVAGKSGGNVLLDSADVGLENVTNNRQINAIPSGLSVDGNIVLWNGLTGDSVKDSGVNILSINNTISKTHSHNNSYNLDSINQNLSNESNVVFNSLTLSSLGVNQVPIVGSSNILIGVTIKSAFNADFETSNSNIFPNGIANVGTSSTIARADHIHPSDPTKLAANPSISGGTYPKITYDSKGLILSGTNLLATDIPNLDASKISTGMFNAGLIPELPMLGDVTGTTQSNTVTKLQGRTLANINPLDTQVMMWDNTLLQWEPCDLYIPGNCKYNSTIYEDFLNNNTTTGQVGIQGWTVNSTGIIAKKNSDQYSDGVISLQRGSTTSNYACISLGSQDTLLGGGTVVFESRVKLNQLATNGQNYWVAFGLGNNTTNATHTNGVWFSYQYNTNNTYWLLNTARNGSITQILSNVAVSALSWISLKAVINADGTSVSFYYRTSTIMTDTLMGTITTNIPNSGTYVCSPNFKIVGTAGKQNVNLDIDYFWKTKFFTSLR